MNKQVFGLVFFLLASPTCFSQRVQWKAFRLTEENDFLNLTQRGIDRYYTQGARFEFLYNASKRKFSERLLVPLSSQSANMYSIALVQQIYTPKRTSDYNFVGDMPYAGTLYLSHKLESYDSSKSLRLTTRLDAGIIGPAALGKEIQGVFHKIIGNDAAAGWDRQLRTDVLFNYFVGAEKQLARIGSFMIEGRAAAQLGTLNVSAIGGLNLKLGNWHKQKKFQWQIFFLPEVRVMAYNALLQGGVFNQMFAAPKYSEYFLNQIKPLVYSHGTGFQIRYQRFELLYKQVNLTPEFSGQKPHYFGVVAFTSHFK